MKDKKKKTEPVIDREEWYKQKLIEWKQRAIKIGIEGKGWISR